MSRFEINIFKDDDKQWRWVIYSTTKKILGQSHKGFDAIYEARKNIEIITGLVAPAVDKGKDFSSEKYVANDRAFIRIKK